MDIQSFLLLVSFVIIVFVVFVIYFMIRLMKMINSVSGLLHTTDESIKPLMHEVTETVKKTNNIMGKVEESVGDIKSLTGSFGDVGTGIKKLSSTLKESEVYIANIKGQVLGISSAVKTILSNIAKGLLKKGEESKKE